MKTIQDYTIEMLVRQRDTALADAKRCRYALKAVVANANGDHDSGYANVPWSTIANVKESIREEVK